MRFHVLRPRRLYWVVAASVLLGACSLTGNEKGSLVDAEEAGVVESAERRPDIRPVRTQYSESRARCAVHNPQRSPHFGDLHVHTARSLDAGIQDTRTTPYQAYQFARGERIGIQPWSDAGAGGLDHMLPVSPATATPENAGTPLRTLQLGRPLDFAMVSDHAEFFGEVRICGQQGLFEREGALVKEGGSFSQGYLSSECVDLRKEPLAQFVKWNFAYLGALPGIIKSDKGGISRFKSVCGKDGRFCRDAARTTWQEAIEAAEAAYDKTEDCEFTAFVGYEYTSTPVSENMHRNVVFRNANVPALPTSYMEAKWPENLWAALDEDCTLEEGCEVFTIPHNSNVSGSRMFRRRVTRNNQGDFDAAYSKLRQQYEPLIEIYQHKGGSECRIDNTDELCSFEKFPYNNLIADRFGGSMTGWPGEDAFIRYALGRGLELQAKLGVNPFRYGLIGSTDTHLGTPGAVNEANFPGHGGAGASNNDVVVDDSSAEGAESSVPRIMPTGLVDNIAFSGGGLAVVWAEENSRDFLFDSMQRRETYGTSGPRMILRFFGGWDYPAEMCESVAYDPTGASLQSGPFVTMGYEQGVPMGGSLPRPDANDESPTFAVAALMDPGFALDDQTSDLYERSTVLQQIQIIKGWLDEKGERREQVLSVAGDPDNGAGVALDTCEPHGPGAEDLCTVWRDEAFDPTQRAYYYARVVENPTCRWSWLQCNNYAKSNGVDWGEACDDKESLPEGFRRCCLHDSLLELADSRRSMSIALPRTSRRESYPETIQERAWSSPIWHRP